MHECAPSSLFLIPLGDQLEKRLFVFGHELGRLVQQKRFPLRKTRKIRRKEGRKHERGALGDTTASSLFVKLAHDRSERETVAGLARVARVRGIGKERAHIEVPHAGHFDVRNHLCRMLLFGGLAIVCFLLFASALRENAEHAVLANKYFFDLFGRHFQNREEFLHERYDKPQPRRPKVRKTGFIHKKAPAQLRAGNAGNALTTESFGGIGGPVVFELENLLYRRESRFVDQNAIDAAALFKRFLDFSVVVVQRLIGLGINVVVLHAKEIRPGINFVLQREKLGIPGHECKSSLDRLERSLALARMCHGVCPP